MFGQLNLFEFYLFVSGGCILLNTIPMIIAIIRKHNAPPFGSYFVSLLINLGIPFIFLHSTIAIFLLVFPFLLIVIPADFFCYKYSFEGNHIIARETFCRKKGTNSMDVVRNNRGFSPCISVLAEAYHDVPSGQGSSYQLVTWSSCIQIPYESWEEISEPISIGGVVLFHGIFHFQILLDESTRNAIDSVKNNLFLEASQYDAQTSIKVQYEVPGFTTSISGPTTDETPCIYSFYTSIIGNILWILFSLCGFQPLFETLWCSYGNRIVVKCLKVVLQSSIYRCRMDTFDQVAADKTFRFDKFAHPKHHWWKISGQDDDLFFIPPKN